MTSFLEFQNAQYPTQLSFGVSPGYPQFKRLYEIINPQTKPNQTTW